MTDLYADPFRERGGSLKRFEYDLLGTRFRFESGSETLLQIAKDTYQGLPPQRFRAGPVRPLTLRLLERPPGGGKPSNRREPPEIDMFSAAGWLAAASVGSDIVSLSPASRQGVIAVSPRTMASVYHARYELIEFATFTLASRCQHLASLHAGCIGLDGRGVLLLGDSGAGKSTLSLLCLQRGLEFLSEDSVFVEPPTMRATGVANYVHLRPDALSWLPPTLRAALRRSPLIRRRSGARKYELDLRGGNYRLAARPLKLIATVVLSARHEKRTTLQRPPLRSLQRHEMPERLVATQAYAAGQPGWTAFQRNLAALPSYELRRAMHPMLAVDALETLLRSQR